MQDMNVRVATRGNHGIDIEPGLFDGSYIGSLDRIITKMKYLIKQGNKIVWSFNERWCTINGQTFNISKIVWDSRTARYQ